VIGGLDLVVFLGSLAAVMAIGVVASRREHTAEDFFLAGRSVRWWGVAGSIFGTNVSASQLVGMLGIGYSIGFAQSHYELGAIAALMLLAYGFLPVFRRLGAFTLSAWLGRRYDGRSQTLYAVISVVVAIVQLTGALYIGSRSVGLLLDGTVLEVSYVGGVVALSLITATYTIFGGLKAVIYTDVVQSVLLLAAGVLVATLTFAQPEVGGWAGMLAFDAARPIVDQKMHLYLASDHPDLPWSGALSGLLILHVFYWSTNQRIVQRTLAAQSDRQARIGIVVAGFLKLTVPFFAIAGGVAAAQLFGARSPGMVIDPDAATPELIRLVVPVGYGLIGLVMAGLIGAILSTIDSTVNSAATLITFDLYKPFARPDADNAELLWLGRVLIALLISISAVLAVATYDPTAGGNFFLRVSSQAGHFTPGLVAAFALGMFWRRATAAGAFAAIISAPIFSIGIVELYGAWLGPLPAVAAVLGPQLNFLHRVLLTVLFATVVLMLVSLRSTPSSANLEVTAAALGGRESGGIAPAYLRRMLAGVAALALAWLLLGLAVSGGAVAPHTAAWIAAASAWLPFLPALRHRMSTGVRALLTDDLPWAALLCAATMFLMFRFF
jgi:SSS family solute:Na+ symporter